MKLESNFAKNPLLEATGVAGGGCCKIKLAMVIEYYLSIREQYGSDMDRIAEKEMERKFFPVARSAHE